MPAEYSKEPRTPRQEAYRRRQALMGHQRFLRIRWYGEAHPELRLDEIASFFAVTKSRISFILLHHERHQRILEFLGVTDAEAREMYGEIPPGARPWTWEKWDEWDQR